MGVYTTIKFKETFKNGLNRTIMDHYMIEVEDKISFRDCFMSVVKSKSLGSSLFLHRLDPPSPRDEVCCFISEIKDKEEIRASPILCIKAALEAHSCNFLTFDIVRNDAITTTSESNSNAFHILMKNARSQAKASRFYPLKYANPQRSDWVLFNDISSVLEKDGTFFDAGQELVARKIANQISSSIYYILPHLSKLKARGYDFPKLFLENLNIREDESQRYNNPTNHKHRTPHLSSNTLKQYADELFRILTEPVFITDRFNSLKQNVTQLAKIFIKYSQYLDSCNEAMNQNHSAFEPLRSTNDGSSSAFQMKPRNALKMPVIIDRYKSLELKLSSFLFYEPLLVNDFAPVNRQKRYRYILELSMRYQTETYSYSAGNYVGASHFVWRTPPCADFNASKQVMSNIDKQIPMYHTRMMRREFQSRFEGLVSTKPVVMQEMYRFLTGDRTQVVNDISNEAKARLDILLQTGDSENLVDLHELIGVNL